MNKIFSGLAALTLALPFQAQAEMVTNDVSSEPFMGADIIVTALKKEQRIAAVPVSLDVFSGEELKALGIVTANEINKAAPSLTITNGGGSNTSIFMRGVGNTTNNNYLDPAITPTYDGVVQGRSTGAFAAAFFDLERVEILKGPQGTLYGRNATGGVINLIPRKPKIGNNSGGYELSVGNYGAAALEGYLNLTVGASSALRVSGSKTERTGFNRDGTDDLDRWSIRGQYLHQPRASLSLRLAADYTQVGGIGAGASYLGHFTSTNFSFTPARFDAFEGLNTAAANAYRRTSLRPSPAFYNLDAMNRTPSIDFEYWGVNADLRFETALGAFEIIPAYRASSGESYFYGPALNTAYQNERIWQESIEARFSGSNQHVDYLFGTFFIKEKIRSASQFNQEAVLPIQNYETGGESLAGFSNIGVHLRPNLKMNFGGRYTHDTKFMDGLINNFASFCGGVPPKSPPAAFAIGCNLPGRLPHWPNFTNAQTTFDWLVTNNWISSTSSLQPRAQLFPLLNGVGVIQKSHHPVKVSGADSRFTWRTGLEFQPSTNTLVYASIEDGYRAGGFQLVEGDTSYEPEFIRSYTVGLKTSFWGGRVTSNVDAFLWDYRDQQIGYFTVDFNSGILVSKTANAGFARIKGIEADVSGKILDNLFALVEVDYLDATYRGLNLLTAPPRNNINCPSTPLIGSNGRQITVGGQGALNFDCSGKPLLFSPRWAANLGLRQIIPIRQWEFIVNGRTTWRSSQYGALEYLSFQKIGAYWTSDASITLQHQTGWFALTAFMNNIENKRRIARPLASPLGFASVIYTAPRLYGLRMTRRF
jgi:iron complex outermembrane receptor protein